MSYARLASTAARPIRIQRMRVAGLLLCLAAIAAMLLHRSPTSSLQAVTSTMHVPRQEPHRALGEAGGALPAGTSVFDDGVAGVARLDPALLGALRRAAAAAAGDGVTFVV